MTDEQFDEICRGALAFDPGAASVSTWSKVRPPRWSWLPTVPEILACGCACGLALLCFGVRLGRATGAATETNPVVRRAAEASLAGLQASAGELPDTTPWTEVSLALPDAPGTFRRDGLR